MRKGLRDECVVRFLLVVAGKGWGELGVVGVAGLIIQMR